MRYEHRLMDPLLSGPVNNSSDHTGTPEHVSTGRYYGTLSDVRLRAPRLLLLLLLKHLSLS